MLAQALAATLPSDRSAQFPRPDSGECSSFETACSAPLGYLSLALELPRPRFSLEREIPPVPAGHASRLPSHLVFATQSNPAHPAGPGLYIPFRFPVNNRVLIALHCLGLCS